MKIKEGYILRTVAGMHIAVPVSAKTDFDGMITLNETAAFLWQKLTEDTEKEALIDALTAEYDVDEATAAADVDAVIAKLNDAGLLCD